MREVERMGKREGEGVGTGREGGREGSQSTHGHNVSAVTFTKYHWGVRVSKNTNQLKHKISTGINTSIHRVWEGE